MKKNLNQKKREMLEEIEDARAINFYGYIRHIVQNDLDMDEFSFYEYLLTKDETKN